MALQALRNQLWVTQPLDWKCGFRESEVGTFHYVSNYDHGPGLSSFGESPPNPCEKMISAISVWPEEVFLEECSPVILWKQLSCFEYPDFEAPLNQQLSTGASNCSV